MKLIEQSAFRDQGLQVAVNSLAIPRANVPFVFTRPGFIVVGEFEWVFVLQEVDVGLITLEAFGIPVLASNALNTGVHVGLL